MAEEKGLANENAEAVLRIELADGASIDCVLDTGFNGSLILPQSFFASRFCSCSGRIS